MKRCVYALVFSVMAGAELAKSICAAPPAPQGANEVDRPRVAQAGVAPIAPIGPNSGNAIEYGSPMGPSAPMPYGSMPFAPMPYGSMADPLHWHSAVPPAHCLDQGLMIGLMKRYFPYPDPDDRSMPRSSMLDIHIPPDARLFIDGNEVAAFDGFFRYDSKHQLIPGVAFIHEIRVERMAGDMMIAVREVDVYLRMGRLTELTFY